MGRYLLMRLAGVIGVIWAVSLITFVLMHAVPSGPFDMMAMHASKILPEQIKLQLDHQYGLDQPVMIQYLDYMRNAVQLNFGYSFWWSNRTVLNILADQWPYSLQLGAFTMIFSLIVGLGLGIGAAIKHDSWVDYLGTGVLSLLPGDARLCLRHNSPAYFRSQAALGRYGGRHPGIWTALPMDLTHDREFLRPGPDPSALWQRGRFGRDALELRAHRPLKGLE